MARLTVVDVEEQTRVPFLRGILTRSLQKAGLTFEHSYRVANQVRKEIGSLGEITTGDLRKLVSEHLASLGDEVLERYREPRAGMPTILVEGADGQAVPYSRGRHSLDLLACGLTADEANPISEGIFVEFMSEGVTLVGTDEVRRITFEHIRRALGGEAAERYQIWQEFRDSHRPLVVLIGGAVGTGKSTIATELAHRLDIVRIQSTDMLREVMRTMISERLLPELHESTFNAWRRLPMADRLPEGSTELLESGFLAQSDLVSVAVEAAVQRSIRERVPLILEGVHVHPEFLNRMAGGHDAVTVPVMLAVLKRKQLKERISGRGRQAPDRRAERYLKHFDEIWEIQSSLLAEADRSGVPIVANDDKEATVHEVVRIIMETLSREPTAT